ncbi:MAG: YicC family protein [bacterium]|nr:YicC family protein [bacterium]
MTGFGAASGQRTGFSVRAEIRSVNHRHLQTKIRLPLEFQHVEPDVESTLRKKLHRGSVTLNVHIVRTASVSDVHVDSAVARAYHKQLASLAKELKLENVVAVSDLVQLPGVLAQADPREIDDAEAKLIRTVVGKAITALIEMRSREGESLVGDLRQNTKGIESAHKRIAKRMPKVVREHHTNLKRRVDELVGRGGVSEADLAREIALLADRLDVSEELSRLTAHLEQLGEFLDKGGAIGRKLDFLAQEFFREANTIGSKCNDARVAHDVVDLKTHIERMREQVQNVE